MSAKSGEIGEPMGVPKNLFKKFVVESEIRVIKKKFSTINNFIKRDITIVMYLIASTL